MKKRSVGILLGLMTSAMIICGCGKETATETANDKVQTEENTEDSEVETDEGKVSENEKDAENNFSNEQDGSIESGEEATAESTDTEEVLEKIAVFLSGDETAAETSDAAYLTAALAEEGYETVVQYAGDNADLQIEQIREMVDDGIRAFVVSPVDPYGFAEVMPEVNNAGISVFNYDELIMDTDGITYYMTFGGREIGQMIGAEIVEREELEKAREEQQPKTIELFMGSTDDLQALFVYNGMMGVLQEYFDDGTLVCKSGRVSFNDTGLLRWDAANVDASLGGILDEFYQDTKTPDIICTGFDAAAIRVQESLEEHGILPGAEEWPLITGLGCEAEAVKDIAEGRMSFSIFMDQNAMAKKCAELISLTLNEKDIEDIDYEQYDNGLKIVGTYICEAQLIDQDNYEVLIDSGVYTEEEIAPEMTPTPVPTEMPEETDVSEAEETPENVEVSEDAEETETEDVQTEDAEDSSEHKEDETPEESITDSEAADEDETEETDSSSEEKLKNV